jgi:gamma-glutamyltranspeptidase/glutathione hydrolase
MKRRQFLSRAGAVAGMAPFVAAADDATPSTVCETLPKLGPKPVVKNKSQVCSSSHPLVTQTMLDVLRNGGNAVDAATAGALMSATVEPHMTNHGGSVIMLYWDARTAKAYQLISSGTLVSGLPPFRPLPAGLGGFAAPPGRPSMAACIPGFIPGLAAAHGRFGTKPWAGLCHDAIHWAEEGHPVSSFEFSQLSFDAPYTTYFPSSRELYTPSGFLPQAGEHFRNPKLAATLKKLSTDGPEYFTKGDWARHFVAEANRLGWKIKLDDMTAVPPRWVEPLRYRFRDSEIVQLNLPERTGVVSAMFLGVLEQLGIGSMGHYSQSPETLYYMAHALRWVNWEIGMLHDPELFDAPMDLLLSKEKHKLIADTIRRTRPKIDLTEHVRLISGNPAMAAAGMPTAGPSTPPASAGSCELSVADSQGNWCQLLNTMASGGIPGVAVDGVGMAGTAADFGLDAMFSGFLTGKGRLSFITGSTLLLKDGRPWLGLGTPGTPHLTVPQVLANILEFGMDPYEAAAAPRFWPLHENYSLEIEARVAPEMAAGLARLGIGMKPMQMNEFHMGSFQISWRDPKTGALNASADPRRCGKADGI